MDRCSPIGCSGGRRGMIEQTQQEKWATRMERQNVSRIHWQGQLVWTWRARAFGRQRGEARGGRYVTQNAGGIVNCSELVSKLRIDPNDRCAPCFHKGAQPGTNVMFFCFQICQSVCWWQGVLIGGFLEGSWIVRPPHVDCHWGTPASLQLVGFWFQGRHHRLISSVHACFPMRGHAFLTSWGGVGQRRLPRSFLVQVGVWFV